MYLLNEIINIIEKNKTKKIAIFVDMDGVVADYRFGEGNNIKSNVPGTYSNKRPIETTINNLKQIHEKTHCEMFILSSCLYKEQANEKKVWLNINMPFIKEDNMIFVITDNFEDRKKNNAILNTKFVVNPKFVFDSFYLVTKVNEKDPEYAFDKII